MLRLIIIGGLVYFAYKKYKSWSLGGPSPKPGVSNQNRENMDDVMVQDPYCNAYFPLRNSVHLRMDEKDFYFCSKECRDKFLAGRSEKN